jgi:hypothetical protein
VGEPLRDRILQFDGATSAPTVIGIRRRDDCPACGSTRPAGIVAGPATGQP